ncbi:hypothetical protein B0H34DRAFT_712869 [Crassisporium funariophilum]|nr:hypothetical protein B0H34DRAFT_712869 [Crassisporium funariophilum]
MYILPILAASFILVAASPQTVPPIPPAGLFCCPPCGPNGLHLDRQQVGPFAIFC